MNENLTHWNKLKQVPADFLKPITGGRLKGKSDINPQWRLQAMTEEFGTIGIGWYYDIIKLWIEVANDGQRAAFSEIRLYIKNGEEWSKPIAGIGGSMFIEDEKAGLHTSDECYKMATTDALSVSMKQLGIASDIYMGLWDGSKYLDKPIRNGNGNITSDDDLKESWEIVRDKPVGRGTKNKDIPWSKLAGNSLTFYIDKEKNKFYSEWYAIRAQKEIDWRAGRQGDEDFESDKPDSLKNLRADVQSIADDVLKTKYKKEIQYDEYTRIIKEADSKEKLITISARIEAIDILIKAFFAKQINGKEYLKYLTKISIADNNGIDILASELYTLDPEAKENRDLLVHYWNEIEGVHKKLGYTDNPSLALNSMKKHLGTNDMHSIFDVKKLQTYFEYLENKLKTKPAKVENKTVIVKATVAKEDDTMNVR